MKKLTFLLFLTCSITFGQETISKNLGDFSDLKVFSGLKVELQKSDESKVVITGKKADQVSIKNKNGTLKFSLKYINGFNYDDINIVLYYSKPINVLDANEGGYITSDNEIKQQHLEVKVQEGGHINLQVDIKYLTVKSVTGGSIILAGKAQNQNVESNTGANYKGFDLLSKQTTAVASAGAVVRVNVSEMLDAHVNFGGTIYYKGNPEELKTKKVIGGTIKVQ